MVPDVYIVCMSPQEEVMHSSSWGDRFTHSAAHSSKRFKPLCAITLLCQGYCCIGKNTIEEFNCCDDYNQTKNQALQFLFFLVSINISEQFFPYLVFKTFNYTFWVRLLILFSYLSCEQMTFHFASQMIFSRVILCPPIKNLCWQFFVPRSGRLIISSPTLSNKTWVI